QAESPFPVHAVGPAMGEEGRGKFDHVARFKPIFAEQFSGQFHAGDVPKISIDTGDVHQPNGRLINNRFQSSPETAPNVVGGSVAGDDPFGAVARAHDFVPVKSVLGDVLRVEPEINRLLVPADIQV